MASQNRDEDVDLPMVTDAENLRLPAERNSTRAGKRPLYLNDEEEHDVPEWEKAGSRQEEYRNKEDFDDDRFSEDQDSNQSDEAQQRLTSSIMIKKKARVPQAEPYEIKTDILGNEWFCVAGKEQKTVYHSDIRYDLEHFSEWSIPRDGPRYKSMLGAGTDDKTSYHPLFDFCGKERADRADCLFCFKQPMTRQDKKPTTYLAWNGRMVLDYRGKPIRVLGLPLTISSKIGDEEARLECMLRSDPNIKWDDILARILRRGDTMEKAKKVRNALNMHVVRFRKIARLISFDPKSGSETLETYLLTTTTAEMVLKNSTKGLSDLVNRSGETSYIELLNLGGKSQARKESKKGEELEKKREESRKRLRGKLRRADKWAQARSALDAQNPVPKPSIYGKKRCTAIEAIVAFKLESLNQHRRDGSVAHNGRSAVDHAAPAYPFDNARMGEFFGSQAYYHDRSFLLPDPNDPYGILSSPTVTAAQTCIVDFLLEPARLQYRMSTLVDDGSGNYKPIFMTNPYDSYWQQLQTLQNAFEQHWAEVGRDGPPPVLYGLLKLTYDTMTWNTNDVPILALVRQSIDSTTKTFIHWQRRQAERQRAKLLQHHRDLDDDKTDEGGRNDGEGRDELRTHKEEGSEDGVKMKEGGEAEEEEDEGGEVGL
ncbi:MAG: hypothetical protein ASARMPREDX12_000042 [Alectoria sarmentosa]|nr:MAG: hypothetical protein ASARMPREDX12_000042 [Alectoria sarmentosa]